MVFALVLPILLLSWNRRITSPGRTGADVPSVAVIPGVPD